MDIKAWEEIESDYKKARGFLYDDNWKPGETWTRDEVNGLYYLLKAFRKAEEQKEKKHLLYARILSQMHHQDFDDFIHRKDDFLRDAVKEYELAEKENPSIGELDEVKMAKEWLKHREYEIRMHENSEKNWNESLSRIEWPEDQEGSFNFHDGEILAFEYRSNRASIEISDGDGVLGVYKFDFYDVDSVENLNLSEHTYIFDFYCYKTHHDIDDSDYLVFDIDYLVIHAKRIKATKVK